jgi:DNA helicase IV
MVELQLHEVANKLRYINDTLVKLKRKKVIRSSLKPVGIGYLFFKNVDEEIWENKRAKEAILEKASSILGGEMQFLSDKVEYVKSSDKFLTDQEMNDLLLVLENAKVDLSFLVLQGAFSEEVHADAVERLDDYRSFVHNFNKELDRKQTKQKILLLRNDILQAHNEVIINQSAERYFSKKDFFDWKIRWGFLVPPIVESQRKMVTDIDFNTIAQEVAGFYANGDRIIDDQNEQFMKQEIVQFQSYFETLESYPLTFEQIRAIVKEEQNNLVVAGAGSGKTSTIVGKAGYIIKKGLANPEEILLVAFNRDVALEMNKRINEKLGQKLKVKTFHSLGLEIIADCKREKPSVSELAADKLKFSQKILEFIDNRTENDKEFAKKFQQYLLFSFAPYKSVFEFNSYGEYIDYLRNFEIRSLKGDLVKSFEECDIANFLYSNGIDYKYEEPYEIKTADVEHRQYKPDFYLPDYHIYIEHFGINRNGKTAPYISQQAYLESMNWKRRQHINYKTTLIETYSYEKQEGTLLSSLEQKLRNNGVVFSPISSDLIFERLNDLKRVNPFTQLLCTFLTLYKSSGMTTQQLQSNIDKKDIRANLFLEIFRAIHNDYSNYLSENEEIDFNDMIVLATDLVRQQTYNSKFKYILVDEFQDISQSRSNLLKTLLDQNGSKLFAVGDDWQSIYRFTGSDISIMLDFERIFGFSQTSFLEETFRFNQKLCDFSCKFILQNRNQIKKRVTSKKEGSNPVVSIIRNQNEDTLEQVIRKIDAANNGRETVFIVGRYNFLEPPDLKEMKTKFPDLSIEYTTVHSSKGLEADHVIIVGLTAGQYGFPSEITDDPLLNLVLAKGEDYPNAEERRLFYVALTRAKKHVYILSGEGGRLSEFLTEIQEGNYELEKDSALEIGQHCPVCKTGEIFQRSGRYGSFYSCSNYPYCEFISKPCPKCQTGYLRRDEEAYKCSKNDCSFAVHICPKCNDGYLVLRSGKFGHFYGCTNYPNCDYKLI